MIQKVIRKLIVKLGVLLEKNRIEISKKSLPQFANGASDVLLTLPYTIGNASAIEMGKGVRFGPGCHLSASTNYPSNWMKSPAYDEGIQNFDSKIIIGNYVTATASLQITAFEKVIVEDDVMFASNINITDGLHGYENAEIPYKSQKIFRIAPIHIKKGTWIGQNVVILPGVTIGEQVIVGSNSVVSSDIPDKCIAVGSPARVVKQWNDDKNDWVSV